MKSVTNRAFMAKKKMYKQPETEISALVTDLMQISTMSPGGGNGPGGTTGTEAPKRSNPVPDSPHL